MDTLDSGSRAMNNFHAFCTVYHSLFLLFLPIFSQNNGVSTDQRSDGWTHTLRDMRGRILKYILTCLTCRLIDLEEVMDAFAAPFNTHAIGNTNIAVVFIA